MNTLSDSLLVGILITLVFGAICFYLYSRITQTEKRVNLLENLLLDLKLTTEAQLSGPEFLGPDSVEAISGPSPLESADVDDTILISGGGSGIGQSTSEEEQDQEIRLYEELARRAGGPAATTPRNTPAHPASIASSNSNTSKDGPVETALPRANVLEEARAAAQQFTSVLTGREGSASVSSRMENNYESMSVKELQSAVKSRGITPVPRLRKELIDALKRNDAGESGQSEKVTLDSFMNAATDTREAGVAGGSGEGFSLSLEETTTLDQQFGEITELAADEESD